MVENLSEVSLSKLRFYGVLWRVYRFKLSLNGKSIINKHVTFVEFFFVELKKFLL